MRYLAIDLGDKRTGLAVGDDVLRTPAPIGRIEVPLSREDELLRAIDVAIDEHLSSSDELVVGLPLNMDGTEGPRSKIVRTFAARLQKDTGRTVHLHDERRSSMAADEAMSQSGLTHGQKKARRDAIAAMVILKAFLESR